MLVYIRPRHWKKVKKALSSRGKTVPTTTTSKEGSRESWKLLGWTKRSKPSNVGACDNENDNKKGSNELLVTGIGINDKEDMNSIDKENGNQEETEEEKQEE